MDTSMILTIVRYISFVGFLYLFKVVIYLALDMYQSLRAHIIPYLFPTRDLTVKYGSWAVVTGAADRVIKCYAKELATKKMNIVLISRHMKDIQPTAENIERESGVKTKCIAVDFREGKTAYDKIREELNGLDIGILVNANDNRPTKVGNFLSNSVSEIWDCIDNNMVSVAMLTSIVLPHMVKQGRGKIVNYTSMFALDPQANKTGVDSASKAFTLFLSRSTEFELDEYNIQVQTLTPATVLSRPDNRFLFDYPSPEIWAKSAVNAIDRTYVTSGHWFHGVMVWLRNRLPSNIWQTIQEAGALDRRKTE